MGEYRIGNRRTPRTSSHRPASVVPTHLPPSLMMRMTRWLGWLRPPPEVGKSERRQTSECTTLHYCPSQFLIVRDKAASSQRIEKAPRSWLRAKPVA